MVHITVCLNTVTAHNFCVDICVTRIHIKPLSINLYCIPIMVGSEVLLFFAVHCNIRLEGDSYKVNCVILWSVKLAICIVQFFGCLPVGAVIAYIRIFQINILIQTLYKVCVSFGVTKTYGCTHTECTKLRTFPIIDNTSCHTGCSLLRIDWNRLLKACFLRSITVHIQCRIIAI